MSKIIKDSLKTEIKRLQSDATKLRDQKKYLWGEYERNRKRNISFVEWSLKLYIKLCAELRSVEERIALLSKEKD
jgi:hypothetical protein